MNLKRLKHPVALADARNFGRVAVQCHLTQSAFSRSIQAAEEEMGLQLAVECDDLSSLPIWPSCHLRAEAFP